MGFFVSEIVKCYPPAADPLRARLSSFAPDTVTKVQRPDYGLQDQADSDELLWGGLMNITSFQTFLIRKKMWQTYHIRKMSRRTCGPNPPMKFSSLDLASSAPAAFFILNAARMSQVGGVYMIDGIFSQLN